ncbi:pseudouridine synthase [Rhodococcus sp. HNM0563]|uniref:pseudouridine synthase n=1 Tax=unclassified Rhodococcus (in: high G+C Gram-positive bacteria) TaxID=192944 RepID=UPI00146BAB96|nr:pseudouridine synthase [Rhodococcus sp. F64268]MCK0089408.1 pseudouridine synthase [Rhodococcus sp. F64268]NLU62934.1 pseudouridine synthase [Rhodococcus sp. HNM0563]
MPDAPLPVRDGLNPTRLRIPENCMSETVVEYLRTRFPDDAARIEEKIDSGEVFSGDGTVISRTSPCVPRTFVFLYRDPPAEARVPFEIDILHHDDNLLVADKPHFLPTTPRGSWVAETALVRLRRELDLPELTPAHRLDRLTAGVLVFTVRREVRRAYQMLFENRMVEKEYEAVAPAAPHLGFPLETRSRIVKERGVLQAREVPGEVNAVTCLDVHDVRGDRALYRLLPRTGKTHQLRVHMNSLGLPIMGDPLYPHVYDVARDDYSSPLQLLARAVEFDDPITGRRTRFTSRRNLAAWNHSTP